MASILDRIKGFFSGDEQQPENFTPIDNNPTGGGSVNTSFVDQTPVTNPGDVVGPFSDNTDTIIQPGGIEQFFGDAGGEYLQSRYDEDGILGLFPGYGTAKDTIGAIGDSFSDAYKNEGVWGVVKLPFTAPFTLASSTLDTISADDGFWGTVKGVAVGGYSNIFEKTKNEQEYSQFSSPEVSADVVSSFGLGSNENLKKRDEQLSGIKETPGFKYDNFVEDSSRNDMVGYTLKNIMNEQDFDVGGAPNDTTVLDMALELGRVGQDEYNTILSDSNTSLTSNKVSVFDKYLSAYNDGTMTPEDKSSVVDKFYNIRQQGLNLQQKASVDEQIRTESYIKKYYKDPEKEIQRRRDESNRISKTTEEAKTKYAGEILNKTIDAQNSRNRTKYNEGIGIMKDLASSIATYEMNLTSSLESFKGMKGKSDIDEKSLREIESQFSVGIKESTDRYGKFMAIRGSETLDAETERDGDRAGDKRFFESLVNQGVKIVSSKSMGGESSYYSQDDLRKILQNGDYAKMSSINMNYILEPLSKVNIGGKEKSIKISQFGDRSNFMQQLGGAGVNYIVDGWIDIARDYDKSLSSKILGNQIAKGIGGASYIIGNTFENGLVFSLRGGGYATTASKLGSSDVSFEKAGNNVKDGWNSAMNFIDEYGEAIPNIMPGAIVKGGISLGSLGAKTLSVGGKLYNYESMLSKLSKAANTIEGMSAFSPIKNTFQSINGLKSAISVDELGNLVNSDRLKTLASRQRGLSQFTKEIATEAIENLYFAEMIQGRTGVAYTDDDIKLDTVFSLAFAAGSATLKAMAIKGLSKSPTLQNLTDEAKKEGFIKYMQDFGGITVENGQITKANGKIRDAFEDYDAAIGDASRLFSSADFSKNFGDKVISMELINDIKKGVYKDKGLTGGLYEYASKFSDEAIALADGNMSLSDFLIKSMPIKQQDEFVARIGGDVSFYTPPKQVKEKTKTVSDVLGIDSSKQYEQIEIDSIKEKASAVGINVEFDEKGYVQPEKLVDILNQGKGKEFGGQAAVAQEIADDLFIQDYKC